MPPYARAGTIKHHLFMLGGVDYSEQLNTVLLTPDSPTQTYRIAVPDASITDTDSATWTIQLIGIQDDGVGSLGRALRLLDGLEEDFVYQPFAGVGQDRWEGVLKGGPIPVGGTAGQFRTFDKTFGVVGTPTPSQSVAP